MRRRLTIALALVLGAALWASRCDPRAPGAALAPAAEETLGGGVTRRDLRFPCGDATCAGWLYLPSAGSPRPPVVVLGHGFGGTRDVGLPLVAERLARAGIAAFAFDYRHFGASGGEPRQVVDPWSQLEDWRAALRFARAQPEVDGSRAALFGSSMGGGHALLVAADAPDLRAVVAQAPLVDTAVEGEATFYGAAWLVRLLLTAWADMALSALGSGPLLVPAIAPTGGFGMIADDAAHDAFTRLVPSDSLYRNSVAARSIFTFDEYDPAPRAADIAAPILLIASRGDRFAPYAAVEAFAARARDARVETFDGDHFDVYAPPASDGAIDAAVRFLGERLGERPGAR